MKTITVYQPIMKQASYRIANYSAGLNPSYERTAATCNMDLREELEKEIALELKDLFYKEGVKQERAAANRLKYGKTVRQAYHTNNKSLLFKIFIDDETVHVYGTHHVLQRIAERKVEIRDIKYSLMESEYHMEATLLDRLNHHNFVIRNHKLDMSIAGNIFSAEGMIKIILTTTLNHAGFHPQEGSEPIDIR